MVCANTGTISNADLVRLGENINAVNEWAEGGATKSATMANGLVVPSPLKVITDARLFKAPTAFSAAVEYTDATQPVTESGIVYAPLPDSLPIGPAVFNAAEWYVLQSVTEQEVAVQAITTHDMASDADYTLTGGQVVNAVIRILDSGVLLTADRNIIVPDPAREWTFDNQTLQTLTIKTLAGTGVRIQPGDTRQVYSDTVNVKTQNTGSEFDTVADMTSESIAAGAMVFTKGYTVAGDKGAAPYFCKTVAQAAADGDVIDGIVNHTSTSGNVLIIQVGFIGGRINAFQAGVPSDETSDCAASVKALLEFGKPCRFDDGVYLFKTGSSVVPVFNIDVEATRGALLKLDTGLSVPILTVNAAVVDTYSFKWLGGEVDCTLGTLTSGQSSTGFALTELNGVTIDAVDFTGSTTDYTSNNGDSGITTVDCRNVTLNNSRFFGWADAGFYPSGNALDDAGAADLGDYNVTDCYFTKCLNGITPKRELPRLIIKGCHFTQCSTGVGIGEAQSGSTWLNPAIGGIIADNYFKKCFEPIDMRLTENWTVGPNRLEDFGSDPITEIVVLSATVAIHIRGTKKCTFLANDIYFKDWTPPSLSRGYLLTTLDSSRGDRSASDISFTAPDTITTAGAVDLSDYDNADAVTVGSVSGLNDGTYDIVSANANSITLAATSGITTETAGAAGNVTLDQLYYSKENNISKGRIEQCNIAIRELDSNNGPNIVHSDIEYVGNTKDFEPKAVGSGTPWHLITLLDFPSVASQTSQTLTVAFPGAKLKMSVEVTHTSALSSTIFFRAFVSAVDVISVRCYNIGVAAQDPVNEEFMLQLTDSGL